MLNFVKKIFSQRPLQRFQQQLEAINALEASIAALSDAELRGKSATLRSRLVADSAARDALVTAFALSREAAKRTLGQRPFDVQILGGLILHQGAVTEMATGEGKTLAAVAPVYFNALLRQGVHVVTVNEYLARRDAVWMGQIYHFLGLSVSCLVPGGAFLYDPAWHVPPTGEKLLDAERDTTGSFIIQREYLRPISRREAYLADITYGTNHEFGFDYLRDNLAYSLEQQVQRGHIFAMIDEVDSILIDEARTPLIISAPDAQSSDLYKTFARVVRGLTQDTDYTVDEKFKAVSITESGIEKVEKTMGIQNMYAPEHLRLVRYLEESLRAKALFQKDKEYVVKDGEVLIVDEFTGRILHGRRYNGGLHQAIEAKEGVLVKEESRTYGKISIQNYFRLYRKISGMTGTAQTSAEEFHKVYGLEVFSIPTNKPLVRQDAADVIYKTYEAKLNAIVGDVKKRQARGQPILIGTTSIEKNEILSARLSRAGIKHETLNAKNNEREAAIIAQAGRQGAVTVATNMAGRGVDIILGGNPPHPAETNVIREFGGLHVIGTERHEARRIDNQLRGRAGRQGDPGSSQFYLSLEDDLMRIFGGERIKNLMERFNLPEDQPIQVGFVSRAVAEAQAKVEGANFDMRKHLLEYDDVLNKQRAAVYKRRQELLESLNKQELARLVFDSVSAHLQTLAAHFNPTEGEFSEDAPASAELKKIFLEAKVTADNSFASSEQTYAELKNLLTRRSVEVSVDSQTLMRLVGILDVLWMGHLEDLDALSESVRLRAYGQKDPLVEYRHEASRLYKDFWRTYNEWVFANIFRLSQVTPTNVNNAQLVMPPNTPLPVAGRSESAPAAVKVGRNDLCPCGSGRKYKKCHGS